MMNFVDKYSNFRWPHRVYIPVQNSLFMDFSANRSFQQGKCLSLKGPSLNIGKTFTKFRRDTRLDPLQLCSSECAGLAEISPLSFCDFYVTWFGRKCGKVGTARPGYTPQFIQKHANIVMKFLGALRGRAPLTDSCLLVPQIDPSVPQPVVQSRRRPLLGPSPG